jgi:hypothetical protein
MKLLLRGFFCIRRNVMLKKGTPTTERNLCVVCGVYPQKLQRTKNGVRLYKSRCSGCDKAKFIKKFSYKAFKKDVCEHCNFKPTHPCQLDVDHIDGNKTNNLEENLQTLCSNCHRLKTYLSLDHLPTHVKESLNGKEVKQVEAQENSMVHVKNNREEEG